MSATDTTVSNVAEVLAAYERELAALPNSRSELYKLPLPEIARVEARRDVLNGWIRDLRNPELPQLESRIGTLTEWRERLESFRAVLAGELLAMPDRVYSAQDVGRDQNLRLSIRFLDRGDNIEGTGYCLETLRLGALMREAGYVEAPPKAGEWRGRLPWLGSIADVEAELNRLTPRRDDLAARLTRALRGGGPA